LMRDLTLPM